MKPASVRPLAQRDLVERTAHHTAVGGSELGGRFFDAAITAVRLAEEAPGIGSPLVGELTGVAGLRRMQVQGFPCGWLYLERTRDLDVIRLLADRQDLAFALGVQFDET